MGDLFPLGEGQMARISHLGLGAGVIDILDREMRLEASQRRSSYFNINPPLFRK